MRKIALLALPLALLGCNEPRLTPAPRYVVMHRDPADHCLLWLTDKYNLRVPIRARDLDCKPREAVSRDETFKKLGEDMQKLQDAVNSD